MTMAAIVVVLLLAVSTATTVCLLLLYYKPHDYQHEGPVTPYQKGQVVGFRGVV